MALRDEISTGLRTYPYRDRIPKALTAIICGVIFVLHHPKPAPLGDGILMGAIALILFFRPAERPFWFFGGIIFGGMMLRELPQLLALISH